MVVFMAISKLQNLHYQSRKPHLFRFFLRLELHSTLAATWTAATSPIPDHLSAMLQAAVDDRDLRRGSAAHTLLIKFPPRGAGSVSLWNKLLNLYGRCGPVWRLDRLFDGMRERDVVSFNTMISECLHRDDGRDIVKALCLYSRMREDDVNPNHITLSVLLTAHTSPAAALGLVEQIHTHAMKFDLGSSGFVGSALVNGYTRCEKLTEAIQVFDRIEELDAVSWNIMIDACARSGSTGSAVDIFSRMQREGCDSARFDCFTLTSVLKTCLEPRYLRLGMQLHTCALKAGLAMETPIGNALITMYSKCEEGMESAIPVFRIILEPNIITWTAMISGFTQNGMNEEGVGIYKKMLRVGMMENELCFASVLPAFGSFASLENGRQVHARIIKLEFRVDVTVGNALIDVYFKCGSLEDAQLVFTTMRSHDIVSWTVMIAGFGQHGKGREAFEVFRAMGSRGFKPDSVTFLAALSACSHGGLVEEGLQIFHSMNNIYYVKPKREHYACVVDLLGRSGNLEEAERFIMQMGLESDPLAWEALLGACRIYGAVEQGERSAKKVMELEPHKDGPYVLLSNIYAERRLWDEKGRVRHRLDASGLKKEVALSWSPGLEV